MVISGGEHKEWPMPVVSDEILDKIEKELTMLFDKEHEEATWDWLLEQGPPQDDDIVWLKKRAVYVGYQEGSGYISTKDSDAILEAL